MWLKRRQKIYFLAWQWQHSLLPSPRASFRQVKWVVGLLNTYACRISLFFHLFRISFLLGFISRSSKFRPFEALPEQWQILRSTFIMRTTHLKLRLPSLLPTTAISTKSPSSANSIGDCFLVSPSCISSPSSIALTSPMHVSMAWSQIFT